MITLWIDNCKVRTRCDGVVCTLINRKVHSCLIGGIKLEKSERKQDKERTERVFSRE